MKIHIVMNGSTKLIITPENPIEKSILESLSKEPVMLTMPDRIEVIDINLSDSAILTNVKTEIVK